MEGKRLVDFRKIKEEVGFALVLDKLGMLEGMTLEGDEFVGFCPFHKGEKKKPTFYANGVKGIFQCFACKRKGNVYRRRPLALRAVERQILAALRRATRGLSHVG